LINYASDIYIYVKYFILSLILFNWIPASSSPRRFVGVMRNRISFFWFSISSCLHFASFWGLPGFRLEAPFVALCSSCTSPGVHASFKAPSPSLTILLASTPWRFLRCSTAAWRGRGGGFWAAGVGGEWSRGSTMLGWCVGASCWGGCLGSALVCWPSYMVYCFYWWLLLSIFYFSKLRCWYLKL